MDRLSIINHLIKKNNYKTYGELGVFTGYTLDGCIAKEKFGVDPQCEHYRGIGHVFCMTSDEYFRTANENFALDLWFIDGLHESSQVDRDIQNSLKHLNPGGTIVMHDCNPSSEVMTTTGVPGTGEWTGDVYKSFIKFRSQSLNEAYVVDTDYGVGIITDKKLPYNYSIFMLEPDKLSYSKFNDNRKQLLNLISSEEFLERNPINQVENV